MSRICEATVPHAFEAGGRGYRVRPASAREAILIYRALWGVQERLSAEDAELLRELALGWLPPSFASGIVTLPVLEMTARMLRILETGVPERSALADPDEDDGEAVDERSALERLAMMDWDRAALDVSALMGMGLMEVFEMPWGGFLTAIDLIPAARAKHAIQNAKGASMGYLKEDEIAEVMEAAYGKKQSAAAPKAASPDKVAADRARLHQLMNGTPPPITPRP